MTKITLINGPLYQWDTGRRVKIIPREGETVTAVHYCNGMMAEVTEENGVLTAPIPNILLQTPGRISVWPVNSDEDCRRTLCGKPLTVWEKVKPDDYVYTEGEIYTIKTAVDAALQEAKDSGAFKGEPGEPGPPGSPGPRGEPGKDGKDADYSMVANTLKGSASGIAVRIDDSSPLEHEVALSVNVGGAEVKKYGRNLLPYPYDGTNGIKKGETKTLYGVTYTDNGDGTITANGTSTQTHGIYLNYKGEFFKDGVSYFAFGGSMTQGSCLYIAFKDENGVTQYWFSSSTEKRVWKKEYTLLYCYIQTQAGKTLNNLLIAPQIEVAANKTQRTDFEAYKEPTPYTADENGNVNGIIGNGESMTLVAEEGATLWAEYNRDITKAFAELQSAILSLGGNV